MQQSDYEKRLAQQSAISDALNNVKIQGANDLNLTLPNLNNNQDYQNIVNGPQPKDVSLRDTTRDVSGSNALSAKYNADIAAKTLHGQQTTLRVDQLVAETQHLLGNTTDISLRNSDGVYGVPELLARPEPKTNSFFTKFRGDVPGVIAGLTGALTDIDFATGSLRLSRNQGAYKIDGLYKNLNNSHRLAEFATTPQGQVIVNRASTTSYELATKYHLSSAIKASAATAPLGTTLDYALDPNKSFGDNGGNDFIVDATVDTFKGVAAGTAAVYTVASLGTLVALPAIAAIGVGIAAGVGFSYLLEETLIEPSGVRDSLKNHVNEPSNSSVNYSGDWWNNIN